MPTTRFTRIAHAGIRRLGPLLAAGVLVTHAAPLLAQSAGSSTTANFQVLNQSMWGSDLSGAIEFNRFLGTSWDVAGSIGGIAGSPNATIIPGGCIIWCWDPVTGDTRTGVVISGSTSGRVGVDVGARINPGNVDIAYGVDASIVSSDQSLMTPGEIFTLGSTFGLDGASSINTEFASFEAWMDLQFELQANMSSTACFFLAGCSTWNASLANIDVTQELLSLNRDGSGTFQFLGQDVPTFNFGEPFPIGPTELTINLPNLETSGGLNAGDLESGGTTDVLKLGIDVPALALDAALPGSSALLGASIGGVGYTLFGSSLGPVMGLGQDFVFDATPMTTLVFDQAIQPIVGGIAGAAVTTVSMPLGMAMEFVFPNVLGNTIGVTPYYWLDNSLSVSTDITLALDLEMTALELFSPVGNLGPLWEENFRTDNLAINVDDRSFEVNFDQVQGTQFFVTASSPQVVPEPITMVLFGSGLVGIGGAARRRRKREAEDAAA